MKSHRFALILFLLSFVFPMSSFAVDNNNTKIAENKNTKIKCSLCHEQAVTAFSKGHHLKAWGGKLDESTCSICHGGLDKHLNQPSKESIISYGKGSKQVSAEQSKQCLTCHVNTREVAFWNTGIHKKNGLSCASCHKIHGDKSELKPSLDVCFSCHLEIKTKTIRSSHHPLREGKIKCWDCHNPHGATAKHNLREDGNQLCYKCHADKRGPFLWEHPPVEENCNICHDVHGSRHPKLLKEKLTSLCQDCHDWSNHPGTAFDQTMGFAGATPSGRFIARQCVNCHSRIHGSYAPVNPNNLENTGQDFVR